MFKQGQHSSLSDAEISIYSEVNKRAYGYGQFKISCPICQHTRKKNRRDRPLSVNIDGATIVYFCHHCNADGLIRTETTRIPMKKNMNGNGTAKKQPIEIKEKTTSTESSKWLQNRGISLETAESCGVLLLEKNNKPVIGFTYLSEDSPDKYEAVKWRTANGTKDFWWDNNATKLWGRQVYDENLRTIEDTIVITEGEMDCLAIKESFKGFANIDVFSVPNGAPSKITTDKKVDPREDGRFKYVWEERERFKVKKIILATDSDTAGDVLADELSRRLNKARCYRVNYKGKKDANDLLLDTGAEALRQQVLDAEPIPLHGLNSIAHYAEEWQSLYDDGKPRGISTGIDAVDSLFTIQTGALNVVTGYPGDGKSAFIDQLMVNIGQNYGWKTCYCSFENPPPLHAVKLSQVLIGKPFFEGQNTRMTQEEKDFSENWIKEHILFQDYKDGGLPTIEAILSKASSAVMRYGIRCLVIDPFNFIHSDYKGLETDMVSDMLTKTQLWSVQHDVCTWFVSHPTKPGVRDGIKKVVTGIDIAKSMAWFSKSDLGLTVFRGESSVEIHVWKARWGWSARCGSISLAYNPVNGRYIETEEVEDDFDWEF